VVSLSLFFFFSFADFCATFPQNKKRKWKQLVVTKLFFSGLAAASLREGRRRKRRGAEEEGFVFRAVYARDRLLLTTMTTITIKRR